PAGAPNQHRFDEIHQHLHGRYIGPAEAAWRLAEFPVHEEWPPVISLQVHLPGEQFVRFDAAAPQHQLRTQLQRAETPLTAWFRYNRDHSDGRHILYQDFPANFVYHSANRVWAPRRRSLAIGRMYHV